MGSSHRAGHSSSVWNWKKRPKAPGTDVAERHLTTYLHTTMDRRQETFSFNIDKSVGHRVEQGAGGSGAGVAQEALLDFPREMEMKRKDTTESAAAKAWSD